MNKTEAVVTIAETLTRYWFRKEEFTLDRLCRIVREVIVFIDISDVDARFEADVIKELQKRLNIA